MTIATVRDALGDALETISGLTAARYVPDQVVSPVAVVRAGRTNYDIVFGRGADEWSYLIDVYVARTAEQTGQEFLDNLREPSGSGSLKTVLEADSVATAAGVDYIRVRTASEVNTATVANTTYLTVTWEVEVCY